MRGVSETPVTMVVEDGSDLDLRPQVVGTATPGVSLRLRSSSQGSVSGQSSSHDEDGMLGMIAALSAEFKWTLVLLALSALDLLCSGTIACVAFVYAFRYSAVSLGCLGFQVLSHLVYSLLLLLRLMVDLLPERECEGNNLSTVSDECLMHEQRRRDLAREKCMNTVVGFLLLCVSCTMAVTATRKLMVWNTWYADRDSTDQSIVLIASIMAWWGFALYVVHGAVCFAAARQLKRRILWNGVFISVTSLLFLLVLGIAAANAEEWSWKAEPIAALLLALLLLAEGTRLICQHRYDVDAWADQHSRA